MVKVFISTVLLLLSTFLLTGCGENGSSGDRSDLTFDNVRLAFIHVGDVADRGYTYRQHAGTLAMVHALGINHDTQVLNFWNIAPGAAAVTAIEEAVDWGADMVFATSFGHGPMMHEAAQQFPDVRFMHATGNLAMDAGLPNFHTYFGNMSQARFISGVAAGLRTENNVLGFVAAHPNAEVITGLTAFYLGARSVNPDVTMYVQFMGVWNNPTLEGQIAQALIDRGADVLGQHADSPTTQTVAQANGVWSVGYNNCMRVEAPDAFLVAPMFAWEVYLTYAVRNLVEGNPIRTDVLYGWEEGMVVMTELNPNTVVPNTAQAMAEAEARIVGGFNPFTGPLYGRHISDMGAPVRQILAPGDVFFERMSAPSFAYIIEGITVID